MDPNLVVGIGVSVGTIALAIATFLMVRQGKAQLMELKRQNILSSSTHEPLLKVTDFKFTKNQARVVVTNVGEGRAIQIGLSVDFVPSETVIFGDSRGKRLQASEIVEYIEKKKQLYSSNEIKIDAKFQYGGKTVRPTEIISFPSEQGGMILNQNQSGVLVANMMFGFGEQVRIGDIKAVMTKKAFAFDELREFLKHNNVSMMAVDIGIICKDMTEKSMPVIRIITFFVDLGKHHSLEDAYSNRLATGEKPYFFPLSEGEIRWQDGEIYRNTKSQNKSEFM